MTRTKAKPPRDKPAVRIRSFTLTNEAIETAHTVSSDASDFIGREVSMGAVLRALLRFAKQQGAVWTREQLCPFIEAEMQEGLRWGREKTKR